MGSSRIHLLSKLLAIVLILEAVGGIEAQTQTAVKNVPPAPAAVTNAPAGSTSPDLLVGAGDLLEISVYGAPDFDKKEVRVSGTGDIGLPLIGSVHVAGKTIQEVQTLIAKKLVQGEFFVDPQVSVFEKEYATQGVTVVGEVLKPGVYPVLGSRRLFDAISMAGGLTPKAGNVVTVTRRNDPDHPEKVTLANSTQASTQGNVEVLPGDTVVVSKAGLVYVVGDVKLPGGFVMENGRMTILQAMAMAQGANPTASLNKAKLIRTTPTGQTETPLELKSILASKAPDMPLQAEDVLFVPNSTGKTAGRSGLTTVLETLSGIAIYHP
jgi:polysaccharide export outer membrane protein